jgi:hypothetical protein
MRKTITIFVIGGFLAVSTASAQGLKRPVDAAPEPEISLADLASHVNPALAAGSAATRVYTNADLKVRPAPVPPVTPPFPEIAAPTGVLEHPGVPEIQPMLEPGPQQYGIPLWDGGFGAYGYSSPGQPFWGSRRGGFMTPGALPFKSFQRPGTTLFGIDSRFSRPSTPSDVLLGPPVNRGLPPSRSFVGRGGPSGSHSGGRGGSSGGRGGSRGGGRGR